MNFPPGPRISALRASYKLILHPYQILNQCYREYGSIFSLPLLRFGKSVFIADPATVTEIFTSLSKKFNAGETNQFLEPFLGSHSLLLIDGPEHSRQRRLLLPAFHGEKMRMFSQAMQMCAHRAIDRWPLGGQVMLREQMQAITLEVITESVFGRQTTTARMSELLELVSNFLRIPALLTFLPMLRVNLGPWSAWGRFLNWRKRLDKFILDEITRRQAQPSPEAQDVLDMLLLARDEAGNPMTTAEIRDECLTLLLAGHETTALSLTWAFVSLLQHREVLEKLRLEQQQVVSNGQLTPEMLPQMTYLDATIKESMRINNLFPLVGRRAIEPVKLGNYDIPVGNYVFPSNLLIHQLPQLYPEPQAFRPERFLGEHPAIASWFPFGGGPRRCIGINFALFEMKVLLSTILSRVELELVPGQDFRPKRMMLALSPPTGVQVRVRQVRPQLATTVAVS
jgi:cytochrome P450